jgi:hypothetical protein
MPVDTRGLEERHLGKRLRIELSSGESAEICVLELTVCEEPEPCCGITYRLLLTNQCAGSKKVGFVYWVGFDEIKSFAVLGESSA